MNVVEELKRLKPVSLKVTLRDGTEKPVAVPKNGNRWSRTSQVLDALDWTTIECLDKDGRMVGVVEADEDDELVLDDADDGADARLARVLLDVMKTTMKETRQLVDAQLRGNAQLVEAMTSGMNAQAEAFRQVIAVQRAHLLAPAPSEDDGTEGALMKMLQMGMMMSASKPAAMPPKKED